MIFTVFFLQLYIEKQTENQKGDLLLKRFNSKFDN